MSPLVVNVLRAKDLFNAQFEFVNLTLDASAPANPVLRRSGAGRAFIVMRLPPQHIADQIFEFGTVGNVPHTAFLSCPTRIAFELQRNQVAFSVCALLDEITKLVIMPGVTSDSVPTTSIEFPDRLLISPEPTAWLHHEPLPIASSKPTSSVHWTEIWNSRIQNKRQLVPEQNPQDTDVGSRTSAVRFRAVNNTNDIDRVPATSLSMQQRKFIAQKCSNPSNPYLISSSQFMLTPLGATARLKSEWSPAGSPTLASWEHETVTGRDQFIRTVELGYLYPFGHRATRQVIKQRDFVALGSAAWISEVQKQVFIAVDELERRYDHPRL
jgi:hypothetical protein